jgi:hypothetical protein
MEAPDTLDTLLSKVFLVSYSSKFVTYLLIRVNNNVNTVSYLETILPITRNLIALMYL